MAVTCKGASCGELKLKSLVPNIEKLNTDKFFANTSEESWEDWFSTYGNKNSFRCVDGKFVSAIQCRGYHCYEMRVRCSRLASAYSVDESYRTFATPFDGSTTKTKKKLQCRRGYFLQARNGMQGSKLWHDQVILCSSFSNITDWNGRSKPTYMQRLE